MDKILFLDIDGVMIPGTQTLIDRMSTFNRIFPTTTIAVLNKLCQNTGALIVFNSTHNQHWEGVDDIDIALINHGLLPNYIHPSDCRTRYPSLRRSEAISDWLSRHDEIENWVAIDDVQCAEEDHMVLVNPGAGLDIDSLDTAIRILGGKPILIYY